MFGLKKVGAPRAFAIGKFAGSPEFLRTQDPLGAGLDTWLDAGWQHAHATRGADWAPAFGAGATYGFVWCPGAKTDHVACGIIAPSADAVGRVYPVVVACPVPFSVMAARWASAPSAAEGMLEEAYALVADAAEGSVAPSEIEGRLEALRAPDLVAFEAAESDQAAWREESRLDETLAPLFAAAGGLTAAGASLSSLVEALAPYARRERPPTTVLLRLPLGAGGSQSASLWLDLIRRIGGWKQTVPSFFWAAEGDTMLFSVAPPRATTIAELWQHDPRDEGVFDLAPTERTELNATSSLSSFLSEHPGASVAELLRLLGA